MADFGHADYFVQQEENWNIFKTSHYRCDQLQRQINCNFKTLNCKCRSSISNEQIKVNNLQLAMIDAPMLNLIVEPEVRRHANQ